MRWLVPFPREAFSAESPPSERLLVVDETRRSGGVGEGIVTAVVESGYRGPLGRVASADSYIPLGSAADLVLLSEYEIGAAAALLFNS